MSLTRTRQGSAHMVLLWPIWILSAPAMLNFGALAPAICSDSMNPSQSVSRINTAPLHNGVVYCHKHDIPAVKLVSRTFNNPNRGFWACGKPMNDPDRCNFFKWADDPSVKDAMDSTPAHSPTSSQQSTSPRHSKRVPQTQAQQASRLQAIQEGLSENNPATQSTPPPRSQLPLTPISGRRYSPTPDERAKRLQAIQQGLSRDPAQTLPSPISSTTGKRKRAEVISRRFPNASGSGNKTPDSHSVDTKSEDCNVACGPQLDDQTACKRIRLSERDIDARTPYPFTPPSTQRSAVDYDNLLPSIPESPLKGKGKASGTAGNHLSDEDDPFWNNSGSQHNSYSKESQGSDGSRNTFSAESVLSLIQSLSAKAPLCISKLKTKQVDLQRSNEHKDERISELEQENEQLEIANLNMELAGLKAQLFD